MFSVGFVCDSGSVWAGQLCYGAAWCVSHVHWGGVQYRCSQVSDSDGVVLVVVMVM
jgi:hypothetical protein